MFGLTFQLQTLLDKTTLNETFKPILSVFNTGSLVKGIAERSFILIYFSDSIFNLLLWKTMEIISNRVC